MEPPSPLKIGAIYGIFVRRLSTSPAGIWEEMTAALEHVGVGDRRLPQSPVMMRVELEAGGERVPSVNGILEV